MFNILNPDSRRRIWETFEALDDDEGTAIFFYHAVFIEYKIIYFRPVSVLDQAWLLL